MKKILNLYLRNKNPNLFKYAKTSRHGINKDFILIGKSYYSSFFILNKSTIEITSGGNHYV